MAATVDANRLTRDIDVAAVDPVVLEEALIIAQNERLPMTWLNASAAPWVPSRPPIEQSSEPRLIVTYAPPEDLLAMKIVAHRTRDVADIVQLAEKLRLRGSPPDRLEKLLRDKYPSEGELGQVLGTAEEYLDDAVRLLAEKVSAMVRPAEEEGSS